MGNSIGIDISGTLIRVSCVCLPRDPDEHQKRTSAGIWEALEKPKQENKKRNCYRNQSIKSMKQDVNYNSEDQRNHHGGPNCCYYEDDSPHYHSFRETPNVSLSDRGTCKTDPKDFASFSNHEFQQNHENPIYRNFNVIHSDDHYQVLNPHISSDQDAPCPYRQFFHNDATPQEVAIKNYLDSAPLWGPPRTFCFSHYGPYPGKAFCFVIDLNDAEDALRKALPYLHGCYLQVTGSGATYLRGLIFEKFQSVDIRLQFHREISCILAALDFLVCQVPGACFRYSRTHRALNSVLPDDKNYTAVPLEKDDRNNFYPFLLVNLKAGVSFHLVTAPNESERVGGSTIGGATFMGLIRLLCKSILTPLDAFLLAQSGDNSTTDMLVGDIYGGDYPAIGLKSTTIASTFGKFQTNCPKTLRLRPANLCQKKWVKQIYRRHNRKINDRASRIDGSTEFQERATSIDTSRSDSPSMDDVTNHSVDSPIHSLNRIHEPHSDIITPSATEDSSLSSSSLEGNNTLYTGTVSIAGTPRRQLGTMSPCSTEDQESTTHQIHKLVKFGTISETPPAVLNCGDPLCCCCGLQRWAHCNVSESSAAAAVGIVEEVQSRLLHDNSELDQLLGNFSDAGAKASACDLVNALTSQSSGDVALDLSKSVVDDEIAANRERVSSIDQINTEPTEADVARSILTMMSFNVAQQAYLNSVVYKCSRIVLVGYYLEMPGYLSSIQHCIDFWSGGKCKINFVRLAINLGALGASLRTQQRVSGTQLYFQRKC